MSDSSSVFLISRKYWIPEPKITSNWSAQLAG
jgi:hypothetical protein